MIPSNYDLQEYYNTRQGRFVASVLKQKIEDIWPLEENKNLTMAGFGYSFPYVDNYHENDALVFALIARHSGLYHWPKAKEGEGGEPQDSDIHNRVVLCRRGEWPFAKESFDRILVIHDGEYSSGLQSFLSEVWRVLKPNGRLLMILPNRKGLWARSDKNPFGHGAPYSYSQLRDVLRECHFVFEGAQGALLTPPLQNRFLLKSLSWFCEPLSRYCPMMSGVYIVEASKRLYALPPGKKVDQGIRGLVWPSPASPIPSKKDIQGSV